MRSYADRLSSAVVQHLMSVRRTFVQFIKNFKIRAVKWKAKIDIMFHTFHYISYFFFMRHLTYLFNTEVNPTKKIAFMRYMFSRVANKNE